MYYVCTTLVHFAYKYLLTAKRVVIKLLYRGSVSLIQNNENLLYCSNYSVLNAAVLIVQKSVRDYYFLDN